MRVTNSMISNSARSHISNAKNKLLTAEEQYTSEKKIQRPSDDPTIAVRSLKYRSTMSQIKQYVQKNVKDAMSWMDTTESAMKNINTILTNMKGLLNEGANDYLESDERNAVLSSLKQYVSAIFEDEADSDYSGRYVFTGYRTDTSLLFKENTNNLAYDITENFKYSDISSTNVVLDGPAYDKTIKDGQAYVDMGATKKSVYRLQLAYDNCSNSGLAADGSTPSGTKEDYVKFTISYKDATGNPQTQEITAKTMASTETKQKNGANAYDVGDGEVRYLYDTGEILIGNNVYQNIQENNASISVEYCKTEFDKGEIRPEMYFACSSYNSVSKKTTQYSDPSDQNISYEVNFNQTMTVNTQAKDAISTDIYRAIDYLETSIKKMDDVETQISETEKMINNSTDKDEIATLTKLKETLETQKSLQTSVMTEAFGKGLTMIDKSQDALNVSLAKLGSRYDRLELTYDKLSDQKNDVEEMLSDNEDMDISDAYINLTQADNLYQYSLSATSKILGNSLLDYI